MRKVIFFSIVFLLSNVSHLFAQCAMCRSTLENNYSNGDPGIGAGINTGILYLLVMPYLAVFTLGYFWFKLSRHDRKELSDRITTG